MTQGMMIRAAALDGLIQLDRLQQRVRRLQTAQPQPNPYEAAADTPRRQHYEAGQRRLNDKMHKAFANN